MFVEWLLNPVKTSGYPALLSSQLWLTASSASSSGFETLNHLVKTCVWPSELESALYSLSGAEGHLGLVNIPLPPSSSFMTKGNGPLAFWVQSPFGVLHLGLCLPLIYRLWCPDVDWFLAHNHGCMYTARLDFLRSWPNLWLFGFCNDRTHLQGEHSFTVDINHYFESIPVDGSKVF